MIPPPNIAGFVLILTHNAEDDFVRAHIGGLTDSLHRTHYRNSISHQTREFWNLDAFGSSHLYPPVCLTDYCTGDGLLIDFAHRINSFVQKRNPRIPVRRQSIIFKEYIGVAGYPLLMISTMIAVAKDNEDASSGNNTATRERQRISRLKEIRDVIRRMDSRWDHGFFISEKEDLQQRLELQQELEKLTSVPEDDLERAADLLEHFVDHWENLRGNPEDQHELVSFIVERAQIGEDQIVAMTLKSNYHLASGHKSNEPTEYTVDSSLYASGSDGG